MSQIKNNPSYFKDLGFEKNIANDTDLEEDVILEYYTKRYIIDQLELDVSFYYKITKGVKKTKQLEQLSVSISIEGGITETTIKTETDLTLLMIHLKAISQFVK